MNKIILAGATMCSTTLNSVRRLIGEKRYDWTQTGQPQSPPFSIEMLLQAPRRQGKPRRRQPVSSFQYRNAPASGHIAEGKLLVIEPGETWTSQVKDITSHHLFIDSACLQQSSTEQLHREPPLPH